MTAAPLAPAPASPLPPSLLRTLPGSAYADPGVFALEQERIFERMWICAVRASDVADAGSFRTVQVGRESVLIVRTRDGDVRAHLPASIRLADTPLSVIA